MEQTHLKLKEESKNRPEETVSLISYYIWTLELYKYRSLLIYEIY